MYSFCKRVKILNNRAAIPGVLVILMLLVNYVLLTMEEEWAPADVRLLTRFAENISPDNVHSEYPRPQMVREDWLNL